MQVVLGLAPTIFSAFHWSKIVCNLVTTKSEYHFVDDGAALARWLPVPWYPQSNNSNRITAVTYGMMGIAISSFHGYTRHLNIPSPYWCRTKTTSSIPARGICSADRGVAAPRRPIHARFVFLRILAWPVDVTAASAPVQIPSDGLVSKVVALGDFHSRADAYSASSTRRRRARANHAL